jgi:uncharacterized membrane protein YfcA
MLAPSVAEAYALPQGKLMEFELWVFALLCCAYFAAGFIDSAAGGGGLLAVPSLLMANIPPDLALGTNKLVIALSMPSSVITYARGGFVKWRLAAVGAPVVLLSGIAGAKALLFFPTETVGKIILCLLPIAIVVTLMPKKKAGTTGDAPTTMPYVRLLVICSLVGFYEGFFGPGAGSFFIFGLHHFVGMGLIEASATSKMLILVATFSALFVFILSGKILYMTALPLAAACIAGYVAGTRMAIRIGPAYIRKMLTFIMILLMVSLIWKFYLS